MSPDTKGLFNCLGQLRLRVILQKSQDFYKLPSTLPLFLLFSNQTSMQGIKAGVKFKIGQWQGVIQSTGFCLQQGQLMPGIKKYSFFTPGPLMLGAHLMISNPWLDVLAEYSRGRSANPDSVAAGEMSGWFIQCSRLIGGRVRPVFRIGGLDYLDPMDGLLQICADALQLAAFLRSGAKWFP